MPRAVWIFLVLIGLVLMLLGLLLLVSNATRAGGSPLYAAEGGLVIVWAAAGISYVYAQSRRSARAPLLLAAVVLVGGLLIVLSVAGATAGRLH